MGFTCDIRFPHNWAEEFYCGEKLLLSIELKCRRTALIRGLALNVSCPNAEYIESFDYSHYIDDQDSDTGNTRKQTTGISKYETDFYLLNENEAAISLTPGTYVFNLECYLPDKIREQDLGEAEELNYTFAVKVKKVLKNDREKVTPVPVLELLKGKQPQRTCFVWPGPFLCISNFSIASGIVSWHYVANVRHTNNRFRQSSDSEEDGLENWLGAILLDKHILPSDDS
ncbi:uncharacterized protein LOC129730276 [Wyeomyia smithii]|uniref:uncharacterized protein LOC129730276 n=1 Tax=Wyeomyia smithii TaxID=174621 RepID=UPI002467C4E2|nr:uncharacterized protein LOC129730276 [Wyeomyia smithii]